MTGGNREIRWLRSSSSPMVMRDRRFKRLAVRPSTALPKANKTRHENVLVVVLVVVAVVVVDDEPPVLRKDDGDGDDDADRGNLMVLVWTVSLLA